MYLECSGIPDVHNGMIATNESAWISRVVVGGAAFLTLLSLLNTP